MPVRYLLDTNIASYIIKGNVPSVRERLRRVPINEVAISAVTEGELRYGVARLVGATRLSALVTEFLRVVTVLPWTSDAAQEYGRLRATLERHGQSMGNLDMMIGAHALAVDLVLVTHDQAFTRIEELEIEDWTKS